MLNKIWTSFVIISILVACYKYFFDYGSENIFSQMVVGKANDTIVIEEISIQKVPNISKTLKEKLSNSIVELNNFNYKIKDSSLIVSKVTKANGIIQTSKDSVDICIGLIGVMTFFMGLMSIAEKSKAIEKLSTALFPVIGKLFPEIPKNHPSIGHMMMNFSANLLGLDNAATPFGLKAMASLQELNQDKNIASNSQIMFLCLHASGLTLIPVSIIAMRSSMGAKNPTDIFIPCLFATFVATLSALILVSIRQKINLFNKKLFFPLLFSILIVSFFIFFLSQLGLSQFENISSNLSNILLLFVIFIIFVFGVYKKIDLFDAFIEGAKEGFSIAIKIIPYLVGILVAISLLRNSGCFDFVLLFIKNILSFLPDTRFIDAMPTAIIKPLSGSGARGMMVDAMKTHGVDSFVGRLSGVLQGSSDTTFYVIAVYFGSISVKNTKYCISTMLIADLIGIISAILISYMFFG